ncbi:MAG: hypothetical protein J6B04_01265 [Clostridia bacterium]|nr:hypothetical protein [Clostridia bacterium]
MYKIIIEKDGDFYGEMESESFVITAKNCGGVLLGHEPEINDIKLAAGLVYNTESLLQSIEEFTSLSHEFICTLLELSIDKMHGEHCESFNDAVERAGIKGKKND